MTLSIENTQNQSKNKGKNRNRLSDQVHANSAKKLWKCSERLIVMRLDDMWLNKMIFEIIFVKLTTKIAKHIPTKGLSRDNNRTIEICFASKVNCWQRMCEDAVPSFFQWKWKQYLIPIALFTMVDRLIKSLNHPRLPT